MCEAHHRLDDKRSQDALRFELEGVLRALRTVDTTRNQVDQLEADLLDEARRSGASWREIALALGLGTPQAASQRAGRLARRPAR